MDWLRWTKVPLCGEKPLQPTETKSLPLQNVRENEKKHINYLHQQQTCVYQATMGDLQKTLEDNREGVNHVRMAIQELELQDKCLEKDREDLHRKVTSQVAFFRYDAGTPE